MRHLKTLLPIFFGVLVLAGCNKRKSPVEPSAPPRGTVFQTPDVHFHGTLDSTVNSLTLENFRSLLDDSVRTVRVYVPPGHKPRGQGRPFPTLYLLHDFGGDDTYFGFYELAHLMDRLIAAGEIQPMIVVQTDARNFYGGSFYTDSPGSARYFTMIDSQLVSYVDTTYNTVRGRRSRAVCGHGMGGYGALKLILTGSDTTFGSVSALSAPLAFAGTGTDQGFLSSSYRLAVFSELGVPSNDSMAYDSLRRESFIKSSRFTPAPFNTNHLRANLLFALAAAFSSVDTTFNRVVDSLSTAQQNSTKNFFKFSKTSKDAGVLFPFDHKGDTIPSVWPRWLAHDIKTLLSSKAAKLDADSIPVYINCGVDDELGLLNQNRAFIAEMRLLRPSKEAAGLPAMRRDQFFYEEYPGYPGRPADHSTFIYDQLAKVIKFHSQFLDTARVP